MLFTVMLMHTNGMPISVILAYSVAYLNVSSATFAPPHRFSTGVSSSYMESVINRPAKSEIVMPLPMVRAASS